MLILIRTGLVSIEKMKSIRRFVLVGAFIIGAIFTPPDVMSQILLAIPLYLLYELGIILAALSMKQSGRRSVASAMQHQQDNAEKTNSKPDLVTMFLP